MISWGPFQSELFHDSDMLQKWWMERKELIDHMSVNPVSDAGCQENKFWMWKPSAEVYHNSSSLWFGGEGILKLVTGKVWENRSRVTSWVMT